MSAPAQLGPLPHGGGPDPSPDWSDLVADIGDRIRAERQARGWSQTELAQRAGLDWGTVKRLEYGVGQLRTFVQLCWGLEVSMGYLLSDSWKRPALGPTLTRQQVAALRAVADGETLATAARGLGMSRDALGARVSLIYDRLGVKHLPRGQRRAAAVRVAVEHGLLTPENRTS